MISFIKYEENILSDEPIDMIISIIQKDLEILFLYIKKYSK